MPLLRIDQRKIPTNCPAVWAMLATGLTKGIFQLESSLGRTWTKKLKPTSVEHLCALGAILRPGTLKVKDEQGMSATEHYCRRKNQEEAVPSVHPVIDVILEKTYGLMIYQENAMRIAREVAGFTPQEADALRKCVSGDTMFVSRQRGWISIDTLLATGYNDDDFLVMDETGRQQWKKIEKIWNTGRQTVTTVRSFTGFQVRATRYHQFLTASGWKARMRLCDDDHLVVAREVEWDGEDTISSALAMVIAGLVTEGHIIDGKRTATFVSHDKDMMDLFVSSCKEVFGEKPSVDKRGYIARLRMKHKKFLKKYMKFGLSAVKELPQSMMGMTKETTRRFLSFMLAAEGGVCERSGMFDFSSKSFTLVNQVKLLLLRFGIYSYIRSKEVKGYGTYYRLCVGHVANQYKLLCELTAYWPNSKITTLFSSLNKRTKRNFTIDTIPQCITKRMIDQYPSCGKCESGTSYTSPLSRPRFQRMAERTGDPYWESFAQGRQQYDSVADMTIKDKEVETYDFTVAGGDTPYIIANGLVIHNSIGKKIPEEMARCRSMFLVGSEKVGLLSKDVYEELFNQIEQSQRYSFNRSHAMSYGKLCYLTAYIKAHSPTAFYANWLLFAREKPKPREEIAELVEDARLFSIAVLPPDFRRLKANPDTDGVRVWMGLGGIKGVGGASYERLVQRVRDCEKHLGKAVRDWCWEEFLIYCASQTGAGVVRAMVLAGGFDWVGKSRKRLVNELDTVNSLTGKEQEWLKEHYLCGMELIPLLEQMRLPRKEGGGVANHKRSTIVGGLIDYLRNPPTSEFDSPGWIAAMETTYLGVPLTASRVDGVIDPELVNCTCQEFLAGRTGMLYLAVELRSIRTHQIQSGNSAGRKMAFLTVGDSSCVLDNVVLFADAYDKYRDILIEENTVLLRGQRDRRGSFVVDEVSQL